MMPDFPGNSMWCQDAWGLLSLPVFELDWKSSEGVYSEDHGAGYKSKRALNCREQAAGVPSCDSRSNSPAGWRKCPPLCPFHDLDLKESVFNLFHSQGVMSGPSVVIHVKVCYDMSSGIQMWIAISDIVMKRTDTQGSYWPSGACRDLLMKELLVVG